LVSPISLTWTMSRSLFPNLLARSELSYQSAV
jgi:hypothetical protein